MQQKPKIFGGHKLRQRWFNMNVPLEEQQRLAILEMIQHADLIEVMTTSSIASIIFSVRVNDNDHCPFETIPNPADPGARLEIVHRILVKVGLITNTNNRRQYVDLPRWQNLYPGPDNFQVTDRVDFVSEVTTQRQVYRDTVASISQHDRVSLFEPVCPNIFAHFHSDNVEDERFFELFNNLFINGRFVSRRGSSQRDPNSVGLHANDTDAVTQLRRLGQSGGRISLSAIVMELAEGAVTLNDRLSNNRFRVKELTDLWHFQLTRMFNVGVMHRDAHVRNVLYTPGTPGNPEKIQIIDFGRVAIVAIPRNRNRGIIASNNDGADVIRPLNQAIYERLCDAQHIRATQFIQGIINLPTDRLDVGVLMFGILCAVRGGGGMDRSVLAERVREWHQGRTIAQRPRDELVRLWGRRLAQAPEPQPIQRQPIQRQPIQALQRRLDVNGITQAGQSNVPNAHQFEDQRLRDEAAAAGARRLRDEAAEDQRAAEDRRLRDEAAEDRRLRDEASEDRRLRDEATAAWERQQRRMIEADEAAGRGGVRGRMEQEEDGEAAGRGGVRGRMIEERNAFHINQRMVENMGYLAIGIIALFFGTRLLEGGALLKSKRSPVSNLKITENTDVSEVGLILKDALNKDDKHSAVLIMAQSLGVDTTINTKFKISDEVLLYMAHTILFAFSPIKYDTYTTPLIAENRIDNSKINILTIKDSPKSSRKNKIKSPKRSVSRKNSYKPIITQN